MKKNIICLVSSVLFLCGCASLDPDAGILSESEKLTIIDMARYAITKNRKNKKFITTAETELINKQMPDVKVRYSGPRQGRMLISWALKKKTVNFIYSGKFLTDSAMWEMGIVKHDYKISKKKANPFQKQKKVSAADFEDLRKKIKQ